MFFFVGENKRTCVCVHGEMTLLSECRQFQFFTSKWTRQLSLNVNAILSYLSLESKHWNLNAKRLLICIICYKNFRIFVNCETRSFKFYITMKENMFYSTIFSMYIIALGRKNRLEFWNCIKTLREHLWGKIYVHKKSEIILDW